MFKSVVNEILQVLPMFGDSGSELPYFIPDLRNFSEMNILSYDINKPWLEATLKEIKNPINNQTFLVQDPEKGCCSFYHLYHKSTRNIR